MSLSARSSLNRHKEGRVSNGSTALHADLDHDRQTSGEQRRFIPTIEHPDIPDEEEFIIKDASLSKPTPDSNLRNSSPDSNIISLISIQTTTSEATSDGSRNSAPISQRPMSSSTRSDGTHSASFGTKVDEDHANYVLMYDMLTGIRIAVSRNQAKGPRKLYDSDFNTGHKLAFDIRGNELTPSSKYDFKFKDYSPWVFRELRELFRIDPAEYLLSLTNKYVLSEMITPGKSGSFFYYSQDYRFIIKTIHHSEHMFLRNILKHYYTHVRNHPNTLLSRFIGLHRVKLPRGRKIHFVVMGNIFPPNKDIHEIYDLKGSTLGRQVTMEDVRNNPRAVRKDLNWIQSGHRLYLGPEKRAILLEQLIVDEAFLEMLNIMDYSLLVGIHYVHRGNRERIRDKTLTVFETTSETALLGSSAKVASAIVKRALKSTDPMSLEGKDPHSTLEELPSERRYFRFYQEEGGFSSTYENNQVGNEIYFLGIIDILTPYNVTKKLEHAIKSLNYDKYAISAVQPKDYGRRFLSFIKKHVLVIDSMGNVLMRLYPKALPASPNVSLHGASSSNFTSLSTLNISRKLIEGNSDFLFPGHDAGRSRPYFSKDMASSKVVSKEPKVSPNFGP